MRTHKPVVRTIVVEIMDGNTINLREGDRSTGDLTWDEALGAFAEITHPSIGRPRYAMETDAEYEARRAARLRATNPNTLIDGRLPAPILIPLLSDENVVDAEVPRTHDEHRCPF